MAAYESFWAVQNEANQAPGSKDWTEDVSRVAADPARYSATLTIKNYASVPAHWVGTVKRAPTVKSTTLSQPPRVVISDCIDVAGVKIVNDKTGEDVRDTANQPPRYRFEAEVVLYPNPDRWLVQKTTPHLDQPC